MATKRLKTVFIVEDSTLDRSMLKDHMAKYANLTVKEYSSGDACIKDLVIGNTEEPDLILMDYFLDSSFGPSKDGLESLSKIKEISPNTNVIMLTSVNNEKIIELAKKKGALDYVIKSATGFKQLDSALEKHFSLQK
jgi:DNA-binding NarL/FixJ family response regulator